MTTVQLGWWRGQGVQTNLLLKLFADVQQVLGFFHHDFIHTLHYWPNDIKDGGTRRSGDTVEAFG